MTNSVQPASTNSLPASFPTAGTPTTDGGAEPQPSTPFRTEMEDAHAEGRRAESRRTEGKLKPSQRKQERENDKTNSKDTAPVATTDAKRQVLPLTFAMPTLADDTAATKQGDPEGAQPKDAGVDILDLPPKAPEGKPVELPPAALSFAARLSLPVSSAAAVDQSKLDQTKLKPAPPDQTKLKPAVPEPGPGREPAPPEKTAPVRAVVGTTESDSHRSKDSELPPPPAQPAKPEFVSPKFEPQQQSGPTVSKPEVATAPAPTVASRLDRVIEPAAAHPTSSNDIRVRVPDSNGGSTEVRFVEAAGEVRVSVRTANPELNQTLRTGLDDLTHKLSNEGVRAEVWHPAIQSTSQSDWSQKSQQDQQGQGNPGSGSDGEQSRGQRDSHRNKPQWLEELETSIGNQKN